MSIGNLKDNGNKGNNFPYQLAVLKLLDAILAATSGGGGGGGCCPATPRVPSMLRSSVAGNVAAGKRSVSIYNAGPGPGVVLGATLKVGETVNFDAGSNLDTLGVISYDGTGTDLLIISVQ